MWETLHRLKGLPARIKPDPDDASHWPGQLSHVSLGELQLQLVSPAPRALGDEQVLVEVLHTDALFRFRTQAAVELGQPTLVRLQPPEVLELVERRRSPRIPVVVPMHYWPAEPGTELPPIHAQTENLGPGGVGFRTSTPPPPVGTTIGVWFGNLIAGFGALSARVARIEEKPGGEWLVGAQFINVGRESLDVINQLVMSQLRTAAARDQL